MCQSVGAAAVRALPASEATACPSAEPPEGCGEGPSPAQVVSELIAAICDGRIEDVLALVDPQVVWRAVTRPGLSHYQGHPGMVRMVADLRAAYGPFRAEVEDIASDADTVMPARCEVHVTVRVRAVRQTDLGEMPGPPIRALYTLRAGRVVLMESELEADQGEARH